MKLDWSFMGNNCGMINSKQKSLLLIFIFLWIHSFVAVTNHLICLHILRAKYRVFYYYGHCHWVAVMDKSLLY